MKSLPNQAPTAPAPPPDREKPAPTHGSWRYACCRYMQHEQRMARKNFRRQNRDYCQQTQQKLNQTPDAADLD